MLAAPVLLDDTHDLELFQSGIECLDQWLKRRARANQISGASRTYVLAPGKSCRGVLLYLVGCARSCRGARRPAAQHARSDPDGDPGPSCDRPELAGKEPRCGVVAGRGSAHQPSIGHTRHARCPGSRHIGRRQGLLRALWLRRIPQESDDARAFAPEPLEGLGDVTALRGWDRRHWAAQIAFRRPDSTSLAPTHVIAQRSSNGRPREPGLSFRQPPRLRPCWGYGCRSPASTSSCRGPWSRARRPDRPEHAW